VTKELRDYPSDKIGLIDGEGPGVVLMEAVWLIGIKCE
jgi:hypothetical protein